MAEIVRRRGEVAVYALGESDAGPLRLGTARDIAEPVKQAAKYNHAELSVRMVAWCAGPEAADRLRKCMLAECRRRRVVIRDSWLSQSAPALARLLAATAASERVAWLDDAARWAEIAAAVEMEVG